MLQHDCMNLGKRIEARLSDLRWSRNQLLEKVTELTPQALSNLITRDSRRSEWDEKIAEALGVSVLWLVYGHEENHTRLEEPNTAIYELHSGQIRSVIEVMTQLDPGRQDEVKAFAEERLILQRSGNQNSIQRAGP